MTICPFADVTAGLGALRTFLQATLPTRGMTLSGGATDTTR